MRIPRTSYANIVATLALFVALGGSSYAALTLPSHSVGTPQLRNGSVTVPKLAFPLGIAAGSLGHAISVGERGPECPARPAVCSFPPPRPPRTIAVATLKLTRPSDVLITGTLSAHESVPSSQGGEDSLEVRGEANVPEPRLNAVNNYSATVTGEHVIPELPGTHRYYLAVGGYVRYPTTATEAQIVAIALPGGEITSCPSAPSCATVHAR